MKAVCKCDFCLTFSESVSSMEDHEKGCSFNPANKTCWTCNHHVESYGCHECIVDHPKFAGLSENENCDEWEEKK